MEHILFCTGHDLLIPDIVRARNGRVYDSKGRGYVDFESGTWAASLGHGHPRIRKRINRQMKLIIHSGFNYKCPIIEAAAVSVLDITGMRDGKCVFLCSGSEAVEFAIRAARAHTERRLFLTFSDSYLAAFGSANAKAKGEWSCFDWFECGKCDRRDDCDHGCSRFKDIPFASIAGFVFEPGSSSGLVRFPWAGIVRRLAEKTRESGGLVLVNEVTTGIGRTGRWFGYQHYSLTPDIVAVGKGLGSGYPVSATVLSREVAETLTAKSFSYSQSHLNDPLGAAVAKEVIDVIKEEDLIAKSDQIGEGMLAGLKGIAERCKTIREVRGRGLMMAIELEPTPGTSLAPLVRQRLMDGGYLVTSRPGHEVLRMDPPLTVRQSEADAFLPLVEQALVSW